MTGYQSYDATMAYCVNGSSWLTLKEAIGYCVERAISITEITYESHNWLRA